MTAQANCRITLPGIKWNRWWRRNFFARYFPLPSVDRYL